MFSSLSLALFDTLTLTREDAMNCFRSTRRQAISTAVLYMETTLFVPYIYKETDPRNSQPVMLGLSIHRKIKKDFHLSPIQTLLTTSSMTNMTTGVGNYYSLFYDTIVTVSIQYGMKKHETMHSK